MILPVLSTRSASGLLVVCFMLFTVAAACMAEGMQASDPVAQINIEPARIDWLPHVDYERLVLKVSIPGSSVVSSEFGAGMNPYFEIVDGAGKVLPDGNYTYELVVIPAIDKKVRQQLKAARASEDESAVAAIQKSGVLASQRLIQSGHFSILAGSFVDSQASEAPGVDSASSQKTSSAPGSDIEQDVVNNDDVIVTGSLCVGFDCVDGESFGFDTIRLKENNLRIKFEDTSTGTFPTNDWQITVNDSNSGGANKFSIDDVTNGKTPFTIEANAPTNSLYVDDGGRVGLRTSTPVLDLHVLSGNTPSFRLEQDGSSGFSPQTWDVAGNEANFFIRDVTGGSRLSFRIRPGAPTSSLDIQADGKVGMGTATPTAPLHVMRSDGTAAVLVQETISEVHDRILLKLQNSGGPRIEFSNSNATQSWNMGLNSSNRFIFSPNGEKSKVTFDQTGNVTIAGTLSQNSDVHTKKDIVEADGRQILARLEELPISTWTLKADDRGTTHMGPMAQDFHAAFGLGLDERHIAPLDAAGVALAAVKELERRVRAKEAQIAEKDTRIAELEKRLTLLEEKLNTMANAQSRGGVVTSRVTSP